MSKKVNTDTKVIKNRKATFEYFLVSTYTAGLQLTGTEIKSIREGLVNLKESYCIVRDNEVWIKGMHISPYKQGSYNNHDPVRVRKLLLTKREIKKIQAKLKEKGFTLITVKMFISDRGFAKLDIALAKGKKHYDKRNSIKDKENKRALDRALKSY